MCVCFHSSQDSFFISEIFVLLILFSLSVSLTFSIVNNHQQPNHIEVKQIFGISNHYRLIHNDNFLITVKLLNVFYLLELLPLEMMTNNRINSMDSNLFDIFSSLTLPLYGIACTQTHTHKTNERKKNQIKLWRK